MSAPLRLPQTSPSSVGVQFTFTPNQGWRSSTRDAAASPPPAMPSSSSSSPPPPAGSSSSPLVFLSSSSLSISPTLGFDCSAKRLPAMLSARAHVRLQRRSSDPATPSPRRRKRGRRAPAGHSDDDWGEMAVSAAGCELHEAGGSELSETGSALMETEEGEEELRSIAHQPLSILVSPVSCKQRPHCPVPLSPSHTEASSLQSSACSSSASPRRPLFINQIVSLGEGSALVLARRSASKAEATQPSAAASSSPHTDRDSRPQLLPFSPLAQSSSSCSSLTTPASSSLTAAVCRSLSCDSAVRRCRSQWRRFHDADDDEQSGAGRQQRRPSEAPQRRITPLLLPPEPEAEDAGRAAASALKEEADSAEEPAGRGGKAAARRARRTAAVSVKRRYRRRAEQSQSQSRIVDFFSSL